MIATTAFEAILAKGDAVVIDGGLATQCEAMGLDIGGDLWSAELLRSNPDAIVAANRTFLDAGARIITTASYQASRTGFVAAGLSDQDADALILSSVDLAMRARAEFLAEHPKAPVPLIAASIGPYAAAMHDGSEYTGDYDASRETLSEFHASRIALLDNSEADLLACETIPNKLEAEVLASLLGDVERPAWVSFCCRDDRCISDGTPLTDVARLFSGHPRVLAVGINCTAPRHVLPLIDILRQTVPDKSIITYPNSGERFHANDKTWEETDEHFNPGAAKSWIAAGATLVGGCCRVGPDQIREIATSI